MQTHKSRQYINEALAGKRKKSRFCISVAIWSIGHVLFFFISLFMESRPPVALSSLAFFWWIAHPPETSDEWNIISPEQEAG
jgi:hypothetical protein